MHFVPINYSDSDFYQLDTAGFQLLITLNEEYFSYAIRDNLTQNLVKVITNQSVATLFNDLINTNLFSSDYQKTIIAVQSNSFCLIPESIFNEEDTSEYAAFLSVKEADLILTDHIENGQNKVIYTFPEQLIRQIEVHFPSAEIVFAEKSWIKTACKSADINQSLHLYLTEKRLHILLPEQGNIRFYNQFDCSTTDELVYYTALVASQLQLNPEETTLILSGRIETETEQILCLQQYFKAVVLFSSAGYLQQNSLPQHQMVEFLGLN